MPPSSANIFRTHNFLHKGNYYTVSAYTKPNDSNGIYVDVNLNGMSVVYTYPDGLQATHEYSVTLTTAIDMKTVHGIDAVTYLMNDAEKQVTDWA